jgi:hypothetical protein
MSGDKVHLVLMVLVALAIIGGLASIVIWYTQPDMRMTLVVDYTWASNAVGVVAILNFVALLGIKMREKWGPLLVIAITIPNRILGFFFFEVNAGQAVFIVWSVVLIVFALLDYKQLPKKEHQTSGVGVARIGIIFDQLGQENLGEKKTW